ncbi:hypothetical protein HIM_10523 [Hirsutella minnesotensis 3608]|uniref:Peptidase M60 domain-containing protein n=1 Tax=Hirsutella minnesotensis 3608 TaxID=1043627 RepID=A0A0F7ZRR7_9HYPO|nr:hypothetical protein HIM_10523 [Hirsutella minnesotensis 3608]
MRRSWLAIVAGGISYCRGILQDDKLPAFNRQLPEYHQSDINLFPQPRTLLVSALPDAEGERERLNQQFRWADFQPTGFYLNPAKELKVTVAQVAEAQSDLPSGEHNPGENPQMSRGASDDEDLGLHILVGTPSLVHPEDETKVILEPGQNGEPSEPLKLGKNTISNPGGGIIYIQYTHTPGQNRPDLNITIDDGDAAQPFPFYREGVTSNDQWKTMLAETKVPFAEMVGKRIIISGLPKYAKMFANNGQDQQELLDYYKTIIDAQDDFSGLRESENDPRDRPSPLRPLVVQTIDTQTLGHGADATNYRLAVPVDSSVWIYWLPELRKAWGMWHELGHFRQHVQTWSWEALAEVTVNIYSLAARRLVPDIPSEDESINHATRQEWEEAKKYLDQEENEKDFDQTPTDISSFVRLVMFEQLRVVFGDNFYHQLHYQSRRDGELSSDADKKHYFMTHSARISGTDLTQYFTKWGLRPEMRTIDEMGEQSEPTEDFTKRPVNVNE